jgi:adenylate cyclase
LLRFLEMFHLDLDATYKRYDMVVHLETVAKSQPGLFGQEGNQHRYESGPEVACALDDAIQEVWKGHPNWQFISGAEGIETVKTQVFNLISDFIDYEVELKFLLPTLPAIPLENGVPIEQSYLFIESPELRVRCIGTETKIAAKSNHMLARREWEHTIPDWLYHDLSPHGAEKRITKTRYFVPYESWTLELDVYRGSLGGLVTLECEFDDEAEVATFSLPDWARDAIDVTHDPRYKNQALALHQAIPVRG